MTEFLDGGITIFTVVVIGFLIVVLLFWLVLPFAIIGIRDRLTSIIREFEDANASLRRIAKDMAATRAELEFMRTQGSPESDPT